MFNEGFEKVAVSEKWVSKKIMGGLATRAGHARGGPVHRHVLDAVEKSNASHLKRMSPSSFRNHPLSPLNQATKNDWRESRMVADALGIPRNAASLGGHMNRAARRKMGKR